MKKEICAISDIHGDLIEIPKCDILCICGDILPLEIQRKFEASKKWLSGPFRNWLLTVPCEYVVMIWGNHDFIGEKLANDGLGGSMQVSELFGVDCEKQIYILQDESIEIDGIKFYGTPWCPNLSAWAFYGDSEKLEEKFRKIPTNTNILLTHCPPKYGLQGVVMQQNWNFLKNFGCIELQTAINDKFENIDRPLYVLSGHIHSGNHDWETNGNIRYVNVSIKDEDYYSCNLPKKFIIEV